MMAEELDLVLERTLDAPVDLVWKAYTDPEHLKRWFAPKPYEISEIELDLRPAGSSASAWSAPTASTPATARRAACSRWSRARSSRGPARSVPDTGRTRRARDAKSFPMTAIITFADAGGGKTALQGRRAAQGRGRPRHP